MTDSVNVEQCDTDGDALSWWCDACRRAGMLHCSEVESRIEHGQMKQLPYHERARLAQAIREPKP